MTDRLPRCSANGDHVRRPLARHALRLETLEARHLLSVEPLGPASPVNTHLPDSQWPTANAVAMDNAGNSVVVWQSANQDGVPSSLRAQRFSKAGERTGEEFRVDVGDTTPSSSAVAMNAIGAFVVVWEGAWVNDLLQTEIYARVFAPDGSPRSDEIVVNDRQINVQTSASVAMDDDGDFVVSWSTKYQDDGPGYDVHARRFDPNGAPRANEFRVADINAPFARSSVAMSGDGKFVIAWEQNRDIYARLFASNGSTIRPAFVVNDYTLGEQYTPSVDISAAGEFVVAWWGPLPGNANGIGARRFDATGQPIGGQFDVSLRLQGQDYYPRVAVSENGTIAVTWSGGFVPNAGGQVMGRVYDSHGAALSDPFQVTNFPFPNSVSPALAVADDSLTFVWSQSVNVDSSGDVFARRYEITDSPPPEIRITGNHQEIASGDIAPSLADFTDFGSAVVVGGLVERTFTISNLGGGPLALVGHPRVRLSGPAAADFRVTFQPAESLAAGSSSSFTILFDPRAIGVRTAAVRIVSDDGDEGEYVFLIQGEGVASSDPSSIQGRVWNDPNGDGLHQPEETGLPQVTMYLDSNGNGRLDEGESSTTTDLEGRYTFSGLGPGVYVVSQVFANDWKQTSPGPAAGFVRSVTLDGDAITDVDFLNHYLLGSPAPRVQGIAIGNSNGERATLLPDGRRQLDNHLAPAADEILIGFDRRVSVSAADITVTDAVGDPLEIDYCEGDAGEPGTAVLRCRLKAPLANGRFTVQVADSALDLAGNALDGEWRNAAAPGAFGDAFPSGDGSAGGDFGFRFDLNLGDTNLDGQIDLDDLNNVRNHFGESIRSPGDADGDGDADIDDLNEVRNRFGSPPTALRSLARDAVFGMFAPSASEKPIRRFTARVNNFR